MKFYEIRFEGKWLGGVAIVRAPSKKKAIQYLEEHYMYARLPVRQKNMLSVTRIREEEVLYIWDGDY